MSNLPMAERIPRIIHFCWLGGGPKPLEIQKCIASWSILENYQLIEWNESNCTFDENEYIRRAYAEKKWAFVADFYRLKALYEYGGIYLDTDVKVYKTFDPLLRHKAFLSFIFDCSVNSAVIGSEPGGKLIGRLLDMYYRTSFGQTEENGIIEQRGERYIISQFITNNYYFTWFILKHYQNFRLNNRFQDLGDFAIYPKELFEIGSLLHRQYTIHLCTGTWQTGKKAHPSSSRAKKILSAVPPLHDYIQIIVRGLRYRKRNKTIAFYPQYMAQRQGKPLPPL